MTTTFTLKQLLGSEILIGSRAWDCSTEESDYDFAVNQRTANEISDFIGADNIIPCKYYKKNLMHNKFSFKFLLEDKMINFIVYDYSELHILKELNTYMNIVKADPTLIISNRTTRYTLVQNYLDLRFKAKFNFTDKPQLKIFRPNGLFSKRL